MKQKSLRKKSHRQKNQPKQKNQNQQQKANYSQNQAEKYHRMSTYSLDEDNKRIYKARATEWEEKAINTDKKIKYLLSENKNSIQKLNRYKDNESVFLTFDARDNSKNKDIIKPHNIMAEMRKSEIGRELLMFLQNNNIPVYLCYGVEVPENLMEVFEQGMITVYIDNTKTIKETVNTVIHEETHARINEPNSIKQEFECYKNEKLHNGIILTDLVVDSIMQHNKRQLSKIEIGVIV